MQLVEKTFEEGQTKARILSESSALAEKAFLEIQIQRKALLAHISSFPEFASSLQPLPLHENAPPIAMEMSNAAEKAGVGPMAGVAGAIADFACRAMAKEGAENAVVDNCGDVFALSSHTLTLGLFAGKGSKANSLGFRLGKKETPVAVCASSSRMGHSFSKGNCDLAVVLAEQGATADCFATALCNRVKEKEDVKNAVEWACSFKAVRGALAVKGSTVGMAGRLPEITGCGARQAEQKITRF